MTAEERQERLEEDLDLASVFRNSLIPYAYRWFSGEASAAAPLQSQDQQEVDAGDNQQEDDEEQEYEEVVEEEEEINANKDE